MRSAVRGVAFTLSFSGSIAALVVLIGTRDVESYDHAFFSLNRGTEVAAVRVLEQPVYTLAVGFGARLPLHGSLGASPAAAVARYLPAPVTYWLLLTLSIAAAAIVVRKALEPLCGSLIAWLALVLLFCSVPIVNYTVLDDWPETAVTYCAFIGGVFAPHALLQAWDAQRRPRLWHLSGLPVAGLLWGLVALAHPGYWPLLAGTLVLSAALALGRFDQPLRFRLTAIAVVGLVSLLAVAPQLPDIFRELAAAETVAGVGMKRLVQGPAGTLIGANAFPFVEQRNPNLPFTFLPLALVSILVGITSGDARFRNLAVGGAFISIALGLGASTLSPLRSLYSPSVTWALRDPAIAFAVLGGACAAAAARQSRNRVRRMAGAPVLAVFLLTGFQGPQYAASLVSLEAGQNDQRWRWNQDSTPAAERLAHRGLPSDRVPPQGRLALWPDARVRMREQRHAAADFPDAGHLLVTAWTKQRTMRGLIEPNDVLFNQAIELSPDVLCDARAVQFLQLRYLLLPRGVDCAPWSLVSGVLVDGWLEVGISTAHDDRVRAVPAGRLTEALSGTPALSPGSPLLAALVPLNGTSVQLDPPDVVLHLDDPSAVAGQAIVLPVAYDAAWRTSSGRPQSVGGLLAVVGVDQRQVKLAFEPDLVAVLRAAALAFAQLVTILGLFGVMYSR